MENLPSKTVVKQQPSVFSMEGFENGQRMAIALSNSQLLPKIYQGKEGIPNCLIALEMSHRMGVSVFMIAQNLDIIQGRPAWKSQFKIGQANASGRFEPLQYEFDEIGKDAKVDYFIWKGVGQNRTKEKKTHTLPVNRACRAVSFGTADGKRYEGPWITFEMAVKEGWWFRDGSKWESFPDKMLMYRAGSWFMDVYDPGASMGLKTSEEVLDIVHTEIESKPQAGGKAKQTGSKVDNLNATPPEPVKTAENAPNTTPDPNPADNPHISEAEIVEEGGENVGDDDDMIN